MIDGSLIYCCFNDLRRSRLARCVSTTTTSSLTVSSLPNVSDKRRTISTTFYLETNDSHRWVRERERERVNARWRCVNVSTLSPSVTKFGDNNPIWKVFKSLWKFEKVIGKIRNIFLQIMCAIGPIFIVVNGQISNKQSSHLVTLTLTRVKAQVWRANYKTFLLVKFPTRTDVFKHLLP